MYIYGSFYDRHGSVITVHIVTGGDTSSSMEIEPDGVLQFPAESPVEIEDEVNDTFDHLLRSSATIRLLSRQYIPEFFATSARDVVVNIYRDDTCLFAGFLEPQSYSQPFNELYDEIELNCIDALSVMQYSLYKNIGGPTVLYDDVKVNATNRTFAAIVTEIINDVTSSLDIVGGHSFRCYYDMSKRTPSGTRMSTFSDIKVSELLFLGDTEDDTWTQQDVLAEIMKYLNLHIRQQGLDFYVFSWKTIRATEEVGTITDAMYYDLLNGRLMAELWPKITLSADNVADCGANISIGEVFNKILLTDKVTETGEIVESPLDEGYLVSPYTGKQKYMTELSADFAEDDSADAKNAFRAMVYGRSTTYGEGRITDWYLQVMNNLKWTFPSGTIENLIDDYCSTGRNQHILPNFLANNIAASLIAWGSVEYNTAKDDNSPISKISMENTLVVSVNGNKILNDEENTYPSVDDLKAAIPVARYVGSAAGGSLSPADEETTNYIVISGKVILNPIQDMTGPYPTLHALEDSDDVWNSLLFILEPVYSADHDRRYYTRKYWTAEKPSDTPVESETIWRGLLPYTGKGEKSLPFTYSAIGDATDTISKVSVLACMLIVGDKCVVETGTQGQTSDFTWQTYKTLEECESEDEYYQQCFTIGFDPKIGDNLIGTEFNLQNNINYTLGIDAEGIAIPITKNDNVSGQVQFIVLGPVNSTWDVITRRHPTWFRHTSWTEDTVPILALTENIIIKEFEVKVYSDNGGVTNTEDMDIVYMSDTKETFTNEKEVDFRFTTMLTSAEAQELNVVNTIKMSSPMLTDGSGLLQIVDVNSSTTDKPEKLYVDEYYSEWHEPRIILEQNVEDTNSNVGWRRHYIHPALNKEFFVQGISRDLIEGTARLTLKEI